MVLKTFNSRITRPLAFLRLPVLYHAASRRAVEGQHATTPVPILIVGGGQVWGKWPRCRCRDLASA
jgi:hypothetical protein